MLFNSKDKRHLRKAAGFLDIIGQSNQANGVKLEGILGALHNDTIKTTVQNPDDFIGPLLNRLNALAENHSAITDETRQALLHIAGGIAEIASQGQTFQAIGNKLNDDAKGLLGEVLECLRGGEGEGRESGFLGRSANSLNEIHNSLRGMQDSLRDVNAFLGNELGSGALANIRGSIEHQNNMLGELLALTRKETRLIRSLKRIRTEKAAQESVAFIEYNAPTAFMHEDSIENLQFTMSLLREREVRNGLYLEFGVFSGATVNLCSNILKDVTFHGFDTFTGLPEDWIGNPHFAHLKGYFSRDGVLPDVNENVVLYKGLFSETLPAFVAEHQEPIDFLHVDCDLYNSTKDIFHFLGPQIQPGTLIVFDEYFNYPNWQMHEHKAFMEFIDSTKLNYEFISFGEMQATVLIK